MPATRAGATVRVNTTGRLIKPLHRASESADPAWPWGLHPEELPSQMPTGDAWPRISLVIPSYNQGRFIEEAIRSILLQGYPGLELIVMDGGSTDESVEVIKHYEPWLTHWISEKDDGQSSAINAGLERATGEVFGWLNSDDYYQPGALAKLMELRARSPGSLAWVGAVEEIDAEGGHLRDVIPRTGSLDAMGRWFQDAGFHQPGCLVDARTVRELGGVDPLLEIFLDVDLWLRVRQRGELVALDDQVAAARIYPDAKSQGDIRRIMIEWIASTFKLGMYPAARWRMDTYVEEMQKEALDRIGPQDLRARRSNNQVLSWFSAGEIVRHLGWRAAMGLGRRLGRKEQ